MEAIICRKKRVNHFFCVIDGYWLFTSLERAEVFYSTTITKSSVKDAALCRAEETARWGIRPVDCIKEWERD